MLSTYFANRWYNVWQHKHHRWKLDAAQISQYSLAGTLNVREQFWEAMTFKPRRLIFLVPNGWLNLCPLICEDLAQMEPISTLIRGVGPTLVLATLMDGPQLRNRWSARYVGVLADDPGSSVMTLSSLGMVRRSRPRGVPEDLTVALWNDKLTHEHPIKFEAGDAATILTLNAEWTEEWTADGRSDGGGAAVFTLQGVRPISLPASVPDAEAGTAKLDVPELSSATPADLIEISVISYFVDAGLDDDKAALRETERWALVRGWKGGGPGGARPVDRVMRRIEAAWKMKGDAHRGGREYHETIQTVAAFLTEVALPPAPAAQRGDDPEATLQALSRWKELAAAAEAHFQPLLAEKPGRETRLAYLSLLWAIHNRAARTKRSLKDLPSRSRPAVHDAIHELLARVERFLDAAERVPLLPSGASAAARNGARRAPSGGRRASAEPAVPGG
jgi:hypothetical protein